MLLFLKYNVIIILYYVKWGFKMEKTIVNLQVIWNHLDDACGSLDNALISLSDCGEFNPEIQKSIEQIDFNSLVNLKNLIEDLIETK